MIANATTVSSWRARSREVLFVAHKFIGLVLGVIFVLIGLSGSLLAFREDIDEWLNAPIMRVEAPASAAVRPLDDIVSAAVAKMPPESRIERLKLPRHPRAAAAIAYMTETDDLDTVFYEIFVDPYTAAVTGQRVLQQGDRLLSQPFVNSLAVFHWTLLLGANNAWLVGAAGIVLFVSALAGLYLWWPRNGDWRLGLKVKRGASAERVVFDLHKSAGFYCSAILLVMLFTGVAMVFKPATRAATMLFSSVRADPDFGKSTPRSGRQPASLETIVASADRIFPDGKLLWILFPGGPNGVYVVGKQAGEEPNRTKTFRNVGVDQYSGEVRHVQDRGNFSAGETFLEWLFPFHSGEAFGAIGRPLFMLIGLVPGFLYVTGATRWLLKRRALRRTA